MIEEKGVCSRVAGVVLFLSKLLAWDREAWGKVGKVMGKVFAGRIPDGCRVPVPLHRPRVPPPIRKDLNKPVGEWNPLAIDTTGHLKRSGPPPVNGEWIICGPPNE